MGPSGLTSPGNRSPYDSTLFSREIRTIALSPLSEGEPWGGVLPKSRLEAALEERVRSGDRACARAADARLHIALLEEAHERLLRGGGGGLEGLRARLETFRREHAGWLARDVEYEAFTAEHGTDDWRQWRLGDGPHPDQGLGGGGAEDPPGAAARRSEVRQRHAGLVAFAEFAQFLAQEQHEDFRRRASALGLTLFADLQIGMSLRDMWARRALFLRGYRLGAPPSRTNPEGQPWNYPVLDPDQIEESDGAGSRRPGPVLRFVDARLDRVLADHDGLRVDHPHGWVCPWVYRADTEDPYGAVRGGARLFESPDLPDHPELARFARIEAAQAGRRPGADRHADDWVEGLRPEQVERYDALFGRIPAALRRHGHPIGALACEVLSTMPRPLQRVVERHGLGRFRVTEKADPRRADDVYRTDRAGPADWVMVGTHDTLPIWGMLPRWQAAGSIPDRAAYLAGRLEPMAARREGFARSLIEDPRRLAQAMFADLFVGPARNVSVTFMDWLGIREPYNRPGTVAPDNWSLRIPADFARTFGERAARGEAFDLPGALALAIRARAGAADAGSQDGLVMELERKSPSAWLWGRGAGR